MSGTFSLDPLRLIYALPVVPYFRREFARVGAATPQVRVRYTDDGNPPRDVLIERHGRQISLVIEREARRRFARSMRRNVCSYAYWLSLAAPEVKHITVNASDGEDVSNARFAPSVRFARQIALPDPHFFQNDGFSADRERGRAAPAWDDRSGDIVWRGGMNGCGWGSFWPEDTDNPAVVQRLRMVRRLKDLAGTDVRLVGVRWSETEFAREAERQGLMAEPMASASWLGRKFAIDIDGYSNTWSNLLVRMLYGCCVLKVTSQFGFSQWYYGDLTPWEHYVPVRADMADFAEKIDWVRSHDSEAKAIAERGRALAQTLTFESQAQRATKLIEEHWDRDDAFYRPKARISPAEG
ncbi:lipopolysaccharide-modifying protein [Rhizobium sp. PDO1-076]|uniref:glycosyl transferase family 90 n=1 Tax=Rhizobium sp. PDO1-076 TaxID=1125979 RepID=UPI00024E39E7|nr:glycosyl transferase family 90 [Rhizobium sp. PDO1-076]EHS48925.1 lipopolysaccharide-modifying protein [Rhizobium sp. PDO1-076]